MNVKDSQGGSKEAAGRTSRFWVLRWWPILLLALSGLSLMPIGWGVGYRLPLWPMLEKLAIGIGLLQLGIIVYCVWRIVATRASDRAVLILLIAAALLACMSAVASFLNVYAKGQAALLNEVTPDQIADECLDLIATAQRSSVRPHPEVKGQALLKYPALVRLRDDVLLVSAPDDSDNPRRGLAVKVGFGECPYWFGFDTGSREWILTAPSPDGRRTILRRRRVLSCKCGYDFRANAQPAKCPECGSRVGRDSPVEQAEADKGDITDHEGQPSATSPGDRAPSQSPRFDPPPG